MSQLYFTTEQKPRATVTYWDTPFTTLENGVASSGIRMTVLNPVSDSWSALKGVLRANANASVVAAFEGHVAASAVIADGRTDTLVGYWAGGAPGWHGATANGRVAYSFAGLLRSVAGRSWFSSDANPSWYIALAGSGYVRVDVHRPDTSVRTIFSGQLSEERFLTEGFGISAQIDAADAGSTFRIYYVQDEADKWGGFVVKAVLGTLPATDAARQAAAAEAPVLGCDLIDDGLPPTAVVLPLTDDVEVSFEGDNSGSASFVLPLVNASKHDGVGYEFYRAAAGSIPTLRCWDNGAIQTTLKAFRLVQITATVTGETAVPLFTGIIEDFANAHSGRVTVPVSGLDHRLQQFDRNLPDKISYMSRGYRRLTGTVEPVYDVPAFDNWPLEHALSELMIRSGLGAAKTRQRVTATREDNVEVAVSLDTGASTYYTFRARTLGDKLLRLGRSVHYGNTGLAFTESKPLDDEYIYRPENTQKLWERCKELTERYGYDFRFDERGRAVLAARNNASWSYDFEVGDVTAGSGTLEISPSAVRGTYLSITTGTAVKRVRGARIDLIVGVHSGTRQHNVTVTRVRDAQVVYSGTLTATASEEAFFYDFRQAITGGNACRRTLFTGAYDEYDVQIAAGTGTGSMRLDSLHTFVTDPETPRLPFALSTDLNAISVNGQSAIPDMRNYAIVVGRRKAAVTDSAKFGFNAENPEGEFIVEAAVDAASVADPTAENFVGYPRQSVIYDTDIADHDHALWLARTFIERQRLPKPAAPIEHTLIPTIRLRQPVYAVESTFRTIDDDSVLYVTGFKHRISTSEAMTSIETTAYPEFPSYEPREDLDIDTYFGGKPIYNVEVKYTSLSGHVKTNLGNQADELYRHTDADIVDEEVSLVDSPRTTTLRDPVPTGMLDMSGLPWPPVPGSMLVKPLVDLTTPTLSLEEVQYPPSSGWVTVRKNQQIAVVDLPRKPESVFVHAYYRNTFNQRYRDRSMDYYATEGTTSQFFQAYWTWDEDARKLTLRTNNGSYWNLDGKALPTILEFRINYRRTAFDERFVGETPYHHFVNVDYRNVLRAAEVMWKHGEAVGDGMSSTNYEAPETETWRVRYRRLGPVDGGGAFVDPYSGQSPFFDVTTSELGHLITVKFDALVSGNYRITVRNAQTHEVVAYLTEPTADPDQPEQHYTYIQAGVNKQFAWDGVDNIGSWNQRQSQQYVQSLANGSDSGPPAPIGRGFLVWNQEVGSPVPLALISGERDANGKPVFGVSTFAQWYVAVEVESDSLREVAELNPEDPARQLPRIARTDDETLDYSTAATSAFIYTHMPEPAKLTLDVQNWIGGTFDASNLTAINNAANWSATTPTDAVISEAAPVRIRFTMEPRPGTLWSGNQDDQRVKLTRQVHLKATIMDQFVVWDGTFYPNSTTPKRTIVSRRLMNDEHTFSFEDAGYRKAGSFKTGAETEGTEWIFLPSSLKKNWRGIENEPLVYGDYLQLEEVPRFNAARTPSGERSRFQIAFMNYLFYLSAFATDTTGRTVFGVNRTFLDKYKILRNEYEDYWNPATPWTAANSTTFRVPDPADPRTQHRRTYVCRQWVEPSYATAFRTKWNLTSSSTLGYNLVQAKWLEHGEEPLVGQSIYLQFTGEQTDEYSQYHRNNGQLASFSANMVQRQLGTAASSALGDWTWESEPTWVPSVTRDFFPYHLVPPMLDKPSGATYRTTDIYRQVDGRARNTSGGKNEGDDVAAGDTWSSAVRDMTTAGTKRFWAGTKVTPNTTPTQTIFDDHADYLRQDELVHYEDLRGMFSRGPRPAEAPKKITPVAPYYVNPFGYSEIQATPAYKNGQYPNFRGMLSEPFSMKFRSEYFWESATMFPVDDFGRERLDLANHTVTGAEPMRFDAGAWTGWKDDSLAFMLSHGNSRDVFREGFMPAAVGPKRAQTQEMIFNLVLVNERRETPVPGV